MDLALKKNSLPTAVYISKIIMQALPDPIPGVLSHYILVSRTHSGGQKPLIYDVFQGFSFFMQKPEFY